MNILVTGDRNWNSPIHRSTVRDNLLKIAINNPGHEYTVIEGGARGVDSLALVEAIALGWNVESVPAEWDIYGRAAGPIRNKKMLDEYKIDIVMAFHDDLSRSRGTGDMVRQAKSRGLPVLHAMRNGELYLIGCGQLGTSHILINALCYAADCDDWHYFCSVEGCWQGSRIVNDEYNRWKFRERHEAMP